MSQGLFDTLCTVLTSVIGLLLLLALSRALERRRPGLGFERVIILAFVVRIAAIVLVEALGTRGQVIRGPDDAAFFEQALRQAATSFGDSSWLGLLPGDLHLLVQSVQVRLLGFHGDIALRPTQSALELAGVVLIAAAAHDVAGRRAGLICLWIAALEPTNVFFSTLLHKESIFMLGQGLVVLGAVGFWKGPRRSQLWFVLGGLVAIGGTRVYATPALLAAAAGSVATVLLVKRFGLKRTLMLGLPVLATGLVMGILVAPYAAPGLLTRLQASHDSVAAGSAVNVLDTAAVDVTTSTGLAKAATTLTTAFFVRPFPWELGSFSQQIGSIGTLLWWALASAVLATILRSPRRLKPELITFAFVIAAETVIFSMSLINTGLGFRHRIHIIVLVSAIAGILWREQGVRGSVAPIETAGQRT